MRNFQYRARDNKGLLIQGQINAENLKAAKQRMAAQGLIVLRMTESRLGEWLQRFRQFTQKPVTSDELIMFNRQLQIVFAVGMPVLQGLKLVQEQTVNPSLHQAIGILMSDISGGRPLSEGMEKFPKIFDPVFVNLVRVGESTGDLDAMLERGSTMVEQKSEQRKKVKTATFYPKLVIGFFGVVLTFVLYVVLPKMKGFFEGHGGQLPLITRIVMGASDFFVSHWYLFAFGAGVIGVLYNRLLTHPKWRIKYDAVLLRLPIFGELLLNIELHTFCTLLEILLRAGIPVLDAFSHLEKSASNMIFAKDVSICKEKIKTGATMATGLEATAKFPKMVKGMLAMGEEGGKLPEALKKIADFYRVQIDYRISNLGKMIEPILLGVIFLMVLVLALAVFLPMWTMSSVARH